MSWKHGYGSIKNRQRVFEIWQGILTRCSNPNRACWKDYGGRGIKVCERWQGENGFVNFLADMGEPGPRGSIERIDCDGDYCPGNCHWIPWSAQSKNRKYNWRVVFDDGEEMTAADAARRLGIDPDAMNDKLRRRKYDKAIPIPISEVLIDRRYRRSS